MLSIEMFRPEVPFHVTYESVSRRLRRNRGGATNRIPTRRGGRPQAHPRDCLEGILWVLRTGARWKDLPECFLSKSTCWRRFRERTETGVFQEAWRRLLGKLDNLGRINWEEAFAARTLAPAKRRANARVRRCKTDASCAATVDDGRSNAPSPGCRTLTDLLFEKSTTPICSMAFYNSPACSPYSGGLETTSSAARSRGHEKAPNAQHLI